MDKESHLILVLLLLLCHKGNMESLNPCPYRCQCFTPVQVLCAEERMSSLPSNISKHVKEVIIMTSSVAYLYPRTLAEGPQLNKLIFLNNGLRSIHAQAFETLTELQELEISGNPWLEHFFLGTFSKQGNLTKLLLNYNRIGTVHPGMFDSLKKLQTLQLKGNILFDLPAFLFMNLHNLHMLDLSLNKLGEVKRETFLGLPKLEILRINNNLISNISADTFDNVSQLIELRLEGNKIPELPDDVFSGLTKLRVLNLRGNLLTTFSDRVFGFKASNLKELNLKGNRLTQLSSLSSLTSLTDLVLSSNKLTDLPKDIFRNVTLLEVLDLSENQLTLLPERVFNNLSQMKAIHLQKNNLRKVEAKLFEDQEFIQQLYLSDNRLQTLPLGLLDQFVLQHIVRLHGNPWKCDCHMWYLHDWVLKNRQSVEMLDRMLCESPGFLRKQTVVSVDKDQLLCRVSNDVPDLSSCTLQATSDTLIVKCNVDKCSPMTVKVQLEDNDGSVKEHLVKSEADYSQCSIETMIENPSE